MSVEELIGIAKSKSDLTCERIKIRYLDAQSISPGQFIRIRFPRMPGKILDLDKIYMAFFLQGISTDPNAYLDSSTVQSVFGHGLVKSGNTLLADIEHMYLLSQSLYDINNEVNTSTAERYMVGDVSVADAKTAFLLPAPGQQYICKFFPRGSILNHKGLLPLDLANDFSVEMTMNTAALSIYSPLGTTTSSWLITGMELHADFITSKSISEHFRNTHSFNLTVTDYSYRYHLLNGVTIGQVRWPSASTSLDKIYVICRNPTTSQSIATLGKSRTAINGSTLVSYQVKVNTQNLYPDPVLGMGSNSYEAFEEFRSAFPEVYQAAFYTSAAFGGSQFRVGIDLEAAPEQFRSELLTGVNTGMINNDIIFQPIFNTNTVCRVDAFLLSSVNVSLPKPGDIQVSL